MTQLLTVGQVAERLTVSPTLVRQLVRARTLGSVKVGARLRVSTDQLDEYVAANARPAVAPVAVLAPVRPARRGVRRYG